MGENTPEPYTMVFGMEWDEEDRMQRLAKRYGDVPVWFPLAEKPYTDKCRITDELEQRGITVPRMYTEGFAHNNCGGGCVKAGQAHWAHTLKMRPETYAQWEREEQRFRDAFQKNVSILSDRRGGTVRRPMTLAAFRERVASGDYNKRDWGGCGCFAPSPDEEES